MKQNPKYKTPSNFRFTWQKSFTNLLVWQEQDDDDYGYSLPHTARDSEPTTMLLWELFWNVRIVRIPKKNKHEMEAM